MEETTEIKKPKVFRSDEYKAKNRMIVIKKYYESKGLPIEQIPEYKARHNLTEEEKQEKAYQSYLKNKERALARYYRMKEQNGIVKEEKVLTDEEKKTKEYFKQYYQEHKEKYTKNTKRIIDEIKI